MGQRRVHGESMFSVADHENENVTDSGTTPARRHLVWSNEQVEKGSQIVAILAASPGGSHPDALECLVINFLKVSLKRSTLSSTTSTTSTISSPTSLIIS